MSFDRFKKNWKKNDEDYQLSHNIDKLKSSLHPLDKLKSNMRQEFYAQILALLFIAFVPYWCDFNRTNTVIFYVTYTAFAVVAVYYLATFLKFYTKIQKYSGTAKKTLLEIHTDLRLNMERYKAFGFLLAPFCICWLLLFINDKMQKNSLTIINLSEQKTILLFVIIIIAISIFMGAIVLWTNSYYGKYAKQIKSVLDELEE
ncbi:hypothetical protein [Flavobacterium cerinum]|uniref:DUF3278 domain-containing protein n=1 Tax=Flavobacterium cerinum TaxID=2502784 RepID=A0ABY5IMX2_9FLAO|nr:hypothetical protein [Flavobacterium cerinum]UUC44140.1 hypothetical protein NOX80_10900 [Flavobacterium cerinum]